MHPNLVQFLILVPVAAVAGCIDAIAGGGGLLTLPAMALTGIDPLTAISTNKLQGTFGVGSAALAFARAGHLSRERAIPVAVAAALGSTVGALAVTHVPQEAMTIALPFVLIGVASYFALAPRLGETERHRRLPFPAVATLVVPAIGFYDGVFGPGAGSFYTIAFVALLGLRLVRAVAQTKLANFASNLASLVTFALSGHILWPLGLAMGCAQFAGARLASRLAMQHGARLVKPLLITVSVVLAVKLAAAPDYPLRLWLTARIAG